MNEAKKSLEELHCGLSFITAELESLVPEMKKHIENIEEWLVENGQKTELRDCKVCRQATAHRIDVINHDSDSQKMEDHATDYSETIFTCTICGERGRG